MKKFLNSGWLRAVQFFREFFKNFKLHSSFGLVQFWSSLKNTLVHVFSKLHSKPYYYVRIQTVPASVHASYRVWLANSTWPKARNTGAPQLRLNGQFLIREGNRGLSENSRSTGENSPNFTFAFLLVWRAMWKKDMLHSWSKKAKRIR